MHTAELQDSEELNGAQWSCALCAAKTEKVGQLAADVGPVRGDGDPCSKQQVVISASVASSQPPIVLSI